MADLDSFAKLVPLDHGLAVVSTARADGTIQSSVVNAGALQHPVTGRPVVAFVAAGTARRLTNLRARPRATVVLRAGWHWAGVEGPVQLVGPDDPLEGIDNERLRVLLRDIFVAAGGTHDDWDEYDRVMADGRRVAVPNAELEAIGQRNVALLPQVRPAAGGAAGRYVGESD